MQPSECCIVRIAIAANLGWLIALTLMWKHGILAALLVSPFWGTAAAMAAMMLFWFVSLFVPCSPADRPAVEADG
jgi:hypothetical protein